MSALFGTVIEVIHTQNRSGSELSSKATNGASHTFCIVSPFSSLWLHTSIAFLLWARAYAAFGNAGMQLKVLMPRTTSFYPKI